MLNKILFSLIAILVLVLVAIFLLPKAFGGGDYYGLFLKSGDIYFGQIVHFPHFGLKNVYVIQVNQQTPQEAPLSIQKFSNIFWGPDDYLRINPSEVVWSVKLKSTGQLAELIRTNPNLVPPQQPSAPQPQALPPTPAPIPGR